MTAKSDWLVVPLHWKDVWRSALMRGGEQSVTTCGLQMTPTLSVNSSDSHDLVKSQVLCNVQMY